MAATRQKKLMPGGGLFLAVLWIWPVWACAGSIGGGIRITPMGGPSRFSPWALAWRRFWRLRNASEPGNPLPGAAAGLALLLGPIALGLEWAREDMWHPEIVLWSICLLCVGLTLLVFYVRSSSLFREELFPCFSFSYVGAVAAAI